jgi:hypothetical protein
LKKKDWPIEPKMPVFPVSTRQAPRSMTLQLLNSKADLLKKTGNQHGFE